MRRAELKKTEWIVRGLLAAWMSCNPPVVITRVTRDGIGYESARCEDGNIGCSQLDTLKAVGTMTTSLEVSGAVGHSLSADAIVQ